MPTGSAMPSSTRPCHQSAAAPTPGTIRAIFPFQWPARPFGRVPSSPAASPPKTITAQKCHPASALSSGIRSNFR